MGIVIGIAGLVAIFALGFAQLAAGFVGIEHGLGLGWAWVALIAAMVFRFTLPITIGAFFGAMNVWGWHWALAALFAAPGMIVVVPNVLTSMLSLVKR